MLRDTLLALLSALLLVLSLPSFDLSFLVWLGLVPLLIVVCGTRPAHGFFLAFVCGTLFIAGTFHWILEVAKYRLLHHAILTAYFGGLYFGLFGLALSFLSRRWGVSKALLTAPFVWVSLEFVRSNLSFLAVPWALLAHSQYQHPQVIQIASITGAYGVSFLIVMVNSALAAMTYPVLPWRSKNQELGFCVLPSKQGKIAVFMTAAVLTALAMLYGHTAVSKAVLSKGVKVSVVQGNIEQAKKWDREYAELIMQTYADLTQEASQREPSLIVWPESATPRSISRDPSLYRKVRHIARTAGSYLLLGSSAYQKFKRRSSKEAKYLNSAFLIHPGRGMAKNQRYDKIRLLPFGEYLPMKETIPWSYVNVPDIGEHMPGNEFTVFELPDCRFAVTICWENIFPDLVRQFVKRGAQFIVNITNEAWFGKTAAPYQFVAMSVFRAVENRVSVARAANTGISCFIDPYGRMLGRVQAENKDIFVKGYLTKEIPLSQEKTFYTSYGDIFVYISLVITVVMMVFSFLKIKRR